MKNRRKILYAPVVLLLFTAWRCGISLPPECVGSDVSVNFSSLEVYESDVLTHTQDMTQAQVRYHDSPCSSYSIWFGDNNPAGIREIVTRPEPTGNGWANIRLFSGDVLQGTINGTLDTFTEITGDPYRIVPVRP